MNFNEALYVADEIAKITESELTGLMYTKVTGNFTAYFGDNTGHSYVVLDVGTSPLKYIPMYHDNWELDESKSE